MKPLYLIACSAAKLDRTAPAADLYQGQAFKLAMRAVDLGRAIAATLGGSSCTHEHDCCGCPTTSASVKRTSAREYFVHLHITRNY